jgi:predicted ATPase
MHIEKFVVENFKRFKRVEFEFNADLNVLTGVNNSGKTSVLEALGLWAECFQKLVRQTGKTDRRSGLPRGRYRMSESSAERYVRNDEIQSVRSANYGDIFHDLDGDQGAVLLEATIARPIKLGSHSTPDSLTVGFSVRAARGTVYDVVLANQKGFDLVAFNDFFEKFPMPISLVQTSPVAAILARENFVTVPTIHERVRLRDSVSVLRNRLHQLQKRPPDWQNFLASFGYILFNSASPAEFDFEGNENTDVSLSVHVRLNPKEPFRELSLLGSGSLQIIEILLNVHGDRKDLNLVLLDEPDSHIHRDLQRRLLDVLLQQTTSAGGSPCQVFVTTHNEGLIRSTRADHLFHLEASATRAYRPILHDPAAVRRSRLQPSRHLKVLQSLGNETALDLLNALESDRLVLVEGDDDARYIQSIVERVASLSGSFQAMYWTFQGVDTLLLCLEHYRRGIFELIRNQRSLWEKCALVFDVDYVTDRERDDIAKALQSKAGYAHTPLYLWPAYTIESTILTDRAKLGQILFELIRIDTGASPPAGVETATVSAHEALRARLFTRLDDSKFLEAIEAQRTARHGNLDHGLSVKALRNFKLSHYLPHAKHELNAGFVHHMATKVDVTDLVREVYQSLGLTLVTDNLFDRLIQSTTPHTRPAAWDELTRTIR